VKPAAVALLFVLASVAHAQGEGWSEALANASRQKKPLVVLFRAEPCERCDDFTRGTLTHPTIQRRIENVVFATLPAPETRLAFYDRSGTQRADWPMVPDTTNFGIILDSILAVAPQFERALVLAESAAPHEADLEAGTALARLARPAQARVALQRALGGKPETREAATVALAVLDANDGKVAKAVEALHGVLAASPENAEAARVLSTLRTPARREEPAALRILPLARQVITGRHTVRTRVSSATVARVAFSVDGRKIDEVDAPPFSTVIDFGKVAERKAISAVAFDRQGREVGRDERVVNDGGETFSLRLLSPREQMVTGATPVALSVRAPVGHRVQRVVLSWNDAERALLTAAPWQTSLRIPGNQVGVLRAVAELDDGRTTEDAVLLNAIGASDSASVQLVELPLTVANPDGTPVRDLAPEQIVVREGQKTRRVESIAGADETPLTVGLLVDISASMQATLPDVQEAAIRFLESLLDPNDRAFLVTFDTRARLMQPATSDVATLRRDIMKMRPDGLTAVHDAMILGLLQFEGIKGRRAMVVFSDGLDITSQYGAADVRELARRVNVPIHVILAIPPEEAAGLDALKRVPLATGGTSHTLESLDGLPEAYARIRAALEAQVVAFARTDPPAKDSEWRPIRVELPGRPVVVFAPDGYYATR
jgi:VWFA-related protein